MDQLPDDIQTASLSEVDPEIAGVLERELHRQQNTLEMIASENFVPEAVMEAAGSVLTNKYAEGYPGRRYYGGCEEVDVAEQLAIDRAKELFGAEHVNVQPHAGAQANNAAYMAMLEPGETILGMALAESIAICGFLVGFFGFDRVQAAPFFVVSFALMLLRFPRDSTIFGPLEAAYQATLPDDAGRSS